MARFSLHFGSASLGARWGTEAPSTIAGYSVDETREYPVMLWSGPHKGDEVGPAKVGGPAGALWVEPTFGFKGFGAEDCTFYSMWEVDDGGRARLEEVLLTVREA